MYCDVHILVQILWIELNVNTKLIDFSAIISTFNKNDQQVKFEQC